MKRNIEKVVISLFAVMLIVLVIVALVAIRNITAAVAGGDWVNRTHAVILEADAILSSLNAGETAVRNYLITSEKRDQEAYRAAFNEMVEHLEVGKSLARGETTVSPAFFADDLLNLPLLTANLMQSKNPVSAHLWTRFSEPTRINLTNFQAALSGPNPPPEELARNLKQSLAQDLNIIIRGQVLYDTNRFKNANLRPETRELLKQEQYGLTLQILNRLLLEEAYPGDITRERKSLLLNFIILQTDLNLRIDVNRQLVLTFEKEGLEAARKKLTGNIEGDLMYRIRKQVNKIKEDQNFLLREREKAAYLQAATTRWTVMAGVILNFLLLALVGWLIHDDLTARRLAARALEDANAQLEEKVKVRTAELANANDSLRHQNLERRWANQALDHQLHYANSIINSIQELVIVISKAFNISRLNPAVLHATQFEAPELIGAPISKILQFSATEVPNGIPGKSLTVAQALKEGREIVDVPGTLLTKPGRGTKIIFTMVALRDQNKVVGGIITLKVNHAAPDSAKPGA